MVFVAELRDFHIEAGIVDEDYRVRLPAEYVLLAAAYAVEQFEAFGEDFIPRLLQAEESDKLLRKARQLIAAYLKERTSVISFDKLTRQLAHDDAVTVRESIHRLLKQEEAEKQALLDAADSKTTDTASDTSNEDSSDGYQNNQSGSRIFVTPILC